METATYESEFVACKTATEQIIDLRHTLRYLGVPIKTKSYLFGDNRSVVTSSTLPHSTLGKRHNILAYHWIRIGYNLSDMLSKHWDHSSVYNMIMKLLITRGPITLISKEATQDKSSSLSMCNNYIMTYNSYSYQEGSKRILSRESKSYVSCGHMNCCLQKIYYAYFIYYLFQDKFKIQEIIKIQQVHQKLSTKQV